MSDPLLIRATALLECWGCGYPARVNELAEMLESVRAQGRQEGFAECRERAAKLCDQKAINCERRSAGYIDIASINSAKDKQISFEEARDDIRTLQPPREEKGGDGIVIGPRGEQRISRKCLVCRKEEATCGPWYKPRCLWCVIEKEQMDEEDRQRNMKKQFQKFLKEV